MQHRSSNLVWLVAMTMGFGVTAAQAQEQAPKANSDKVGDYDGVHPGAGAVAPGARGKKAAKIYWIGFQPKDDGSSRFFVQLGVEPTYQQWTEGKRLIVHLDRVHMHRRNDARRLDVHFFDGAVAQVRARSVARRKARGERPAHDRGVDLQIDFKNPADLGQASITSAQEADGFTYLYLDFGPGTATASDSTPAEQ